MTYDARKAVTKQIQRAQAATSDYVDGVMSVKEAPTQRAKRKLDKMKAGIIAAIDSGKVAEGLDSVSLEDWQKATSGKGGERYASGVAAAEDKSLAFHEQFATFMASHLSKIDAMPDLTAEQRIAKMVENARGISKFKRSRRRR